MTGEQWVTVGRIGRPHGVNGECRVLSYTRPARNLCAYRQWRLRSDRFEVRTLVIGIRPHGTGFVARLDGYTDREQVAALTGLAVEVLREALPPTGEGEYYWTDLEGLEVRTGGQSLGRVDHLIETGANDVLVVRGERERLVPFIPVQVVLDVDLTAGVITVDWDPDF